MIGQMPPVLSRVTARALMAGAQACVNPASEKTSLDLRDALCARYSAFDVILTDTGTSALTLALRSVVKKGGTVAFPAYGCVDLTTAAVNAGVNVRLYDVEPATLGPDLESLQRAVALGVDAILVAHLFGYPADVPAVKKIAADAGIPVIEDAAQAAGGRLSGQRLGALADLSILSFGRGKGTTGGRGGALLARSHEMVARIATIRSEVDPAPRGLGILFGLAAQAVFGHPLLYAIPASMPWLKLGETIYREPETPRVMANCAVHVLHSSLRYHDVEVNERRVRALSLMQHLREVRNLSAIRIIPGADPGYLRLPFLDTAAALRTSKPLGITRGYPLTLADHIPLHPILRASDSSFPGAIALRDSLVTLPTHRWVNARYMTRVAAWLSKTSAAIVPTIHLVSELS